MSALEIILVCILILLVLAFLSFRKNPGQFLAALWLRLTTFCINIGGAALSFLYVIWPLDLVPDIILFFGWLDDLGALGLGIFLLKKAFTFPNPLGPSAKAKRLG